MEVWLDTEKCQGHLRCMAIAPDVFDCDDLGYGVVVLSGPVPAESAERVSRCVSNCPENALTLQ
ncbi:ferredoxin [Streptomyces sp. NPDC102437]|uniref:ferredoxin n=1 Tax=Streptomyces sp. NPDC102437 TaxID=3366175 RepID=UPI0038015439